MVRRDKPPRDVIRITFGQGPAGLRLATQMTVHPVARVGLSTFNQGKGALLAPANQE
jgi:hypothetical protein